METLAYLHLALANEAPTSADCQAEKTFRECPKLFAYLNSLRFSSSAAVHLLSLTIALCIVGMAHQASALVQQGDSGAQVTTIQQRLQELGYFQGNATGYFGSVTKAAVIEFQQAKGLNPDGIVGSNTQASLQGVAQSSSASVSQSSSDSLRIGDRGEDVADMQRRLSEIGFRNGEKGVFDEATQEAVRQFQQAKGLTVDGVVGQQTLAALPQIEKIKSAVVDESKPKSEPMEVLKSPSVESSKPKPAPEKATKKWYEDDSAPLTPFTK